MKFRVPNKENHYALWDWLARNPGKMKYDWPGFATMIRLGIKPPSNYCFLCEETKDSCVMSNGFDCPLYSCMYSPGSFEKWDNDRNNTALARQIRDCWK